MNDNGKKYLAGLVVAVVSLLAYANTLYNGFVFDDIPMVLGNHWIKEPGHLYEILTTTFWTFSSDKELSKYYRPMVHLVFSAEYRLFGLSAWGWHLVPTLIHTVNSLLVFLLAGRLIIAGEGRWGAGHGPDGLAGQLPALAGAALWAAHPVHVEVVAWVSALSEVSYTMNYLAALYLYVRAEQDSGPGTRPGAVPTLVFFSAFFFALSTMSKETAMTFPAMLLVYDFSRRGTGLVRLWKRYLPFAAVIAVYFAVRAYAMGGKDVIATSDGLSLFHLVINIPPVVMKYIGKLFVPTDLNAYYIISLYDHVSAWSVVSALILVAVVVAVVLFRRSTGVFTAFGLMCAPLLPALYLPALMPMIFAERYIYLPSAGAAVLLSCGLAALVRTLGPTRALTGSIAAVACVLVLVSGWATHERVKVWRDGYSLWTDTVKKSPGNGAAFYNLGQAAFDRGRYDESIAAYRRAIELYRVPADKVDALINLGNVYARAGQLEASIASYDAALRIDPTSRNAMQNRAYVIMMIRRGR